MTGLGAKFVGVSLGANIGCAATIIIMVDIYLNLQGSQVAFLSIPLSDIQRLCIHPFCWLRYVMFSICGAHGDLSTTPGGPLVDYHSTELANIPYYYTPSGKFLVVCKIVTCHGFHAHFFRAL